MKKHTTKDAYFDRLKTLASIDKVSIKESKTRNLGTLIDYKRALDGVSYGIVKENHHYYLKKGGLKKDPDVSDFVYIGGLENITGFQYKSLAEADKQRNMLFNTLNESFGIKTNKTNTKMVLKEDEASKEIDQAVDKLDDLDAATSSEEMPVDGGDEMAAGLEAEPMGGEEIPTDGGGDIPTGEEMPIDGGGDMPMGGEEMPTDGGGDMPTGEEMPTDGGEDMPTDGEEVPAGDGGEEDGSVTSGEYSELRKIVGKAITKIGEIPLEPTQTKYLVNSFLAAFEGKFDDIDIDDKEKMVEKIMAEPSEEELENLGQNVEDNEAAAEMEENKQCSECGNFAMYAESMGYESAEALKECGEEGVGNLISNYANHNADGMNDGDPEGVGLIIKIVNPEILNKLKGDYGHEEYAEKVAPYVDQVNEGSEEEMMAQFNEGFGAGLAGLGKAALGGIGSLAKKGLQKTGQAIGQTAQKAGQVIGQTAQKTGQAIGQTAQKAGQIYQAASKAGDIKSGQKTMGKSQAKIDALANKLTSDVSKEINNLKAGAQKAGEQIDVNQVLDQVLAKIKQSYSPQTNTAIAENDVANTETKPIGFAPDSQNLGVAKISESEQKIRKYVRNRLQERAGLKKASINEGKKSDKLKKLDEMIDNQFKMYESKGKLSKPKTKLSESEQKIRKYVRNRLQEHAGLKKASINEGKKSAALKKLDALIDEQFKIIKSKNKSNK